MQPVLISNNTTRAAEQKAALVMAVTYLNGLNGLLKVAGLTPTFNDLVTVSTKLIAEFGNSRWLHSFVLDALTAKAGAQSFGGVPLSSDKVREMIAVPSLEAIESHVEENAYFIGNYIFEADLIEIVGGNVQAKATANTTIDNRNKTYTANDKGAEVATKLFALAQQLNEHRAYLANTIGDETGKTPDLSLYGLSIDNRLYKPSLRFIRNQEALNPAYVVA